MVEKKLFWTEKKSKSLTKSARFSNTVTLQYVHINGMDYASSF